MKQPANLTKMPLFLYACTNRGNAYCLFKTASFSLLILFFAFCSGSQKKDDPVPQEKKTETEISESFKGDENSPKISDDKNSFTESEIDDELAFSAEDTALGKEDPSASEEAENQLASEKAEDDSEKIRLEEEQKELERLRLEREKQKEEEEHLRIQKEQEELERLRLEKELAEKRKREREERLNRNDPERNMFFRKEVKGKMGDTLRIHAPEGSEVLIAKNDNFMHFYGGVKLQEKNLKVIPVNGEIEDLTEILQNQKGSYVILLQIPDKNDQKKHLYLLEVAQQGKQILRILNIYSDGRDLLLVDAEDKKDHRFFYRWSVDRILIVR